VIEEAISRLAPQVDKLALNSNGDPARFAHLSLPVLSDTFGSYDGPLAGILAGLIWAETLGADRLVTAAGDTPFLPVDLVPRLADAGLGKSIAIASSDNQRHPTFALWPVMLRKDLAHFLASQPSRRVNDFINRHSHRLVDFPTSPFDPFFNINTPDDLAQAQRLADLCP
jgi:molybdopterin-guanine dinucleotide biosynthesis protein A